MNRVANKIEQEWEGLTKFWKWLLDNHIYLFLSGHLTDKDQIVEVAEYIDEGEKHEWHQIDGTMRPKSEVPVFKMDDGNIFAVYLHYLEE